MIYRLMSTRVIYEFEKPTHRFTVIIGNSGSGKSEFYRLVLAYNRFPEDIICKCNNNKVNLPIQVFPNTGLTYDSKQDGSIIVIDEDCDICYKIKELLKIVENSNDYFIIIFRDLKKLAALSISIKNVCYIEHNKSANVIKPYFPNPIYSAYKDNIIINNILCEDSKSSFLFFRDYYNYNFNLNLFTSNGKDNISHKLKEMISTGLDNILVVLDSCAFGLRICELLDLIKEYPTKKIYILDWLSYEYYLLQSANIKNIQDIKEPICNEERFYYEELRRHLLGYSKWDKGNKNNIPDCLNLSKRCIKLQCSHFYDECTSQVNDKFSFDKKKVYLHNTLERFNFQPRIAPTLSEYDKKKLNKMHLF